MIFLSASNYIEEDSVIKVVRYMPVATATCGSSPMIAKPLPKTRPGPIPLKAANKDPKKASAMMICKFAAFIVKSPSVKL